MDSDKSFPQNKFLLCACLVCFVGGLGFIFSSPVIFDALLTLRPGSIIHHYWKDVKRDLATDMFFFNWTNPEDIYNASVKPKFEQVGPYRFWQKEEKKNVTWNTNGTITYILQRFWHYDESKENGDWNDQIVTMNPIALGAASIVGQWNYFLRRGMFFALSPSLKKISVTRSVEELLYKGYPEPMLKKAASLPFLSYLELPKWDKFGWTYKRNGSMDYLGVFNMGTGTNSTFGELNSWNYTRKSPYFDGDCARIHGSLGEFFPRNLKKDIVYMYSPDMRATVSLEYEAEEIVNNVLGYKYVLGNVFIDNGTIYPKNKCFCQGECGPFGLFNLTYMRPGIPMFVSLPHLNKVDPYYISQMEGLQPDPSRDIFSITIEPTTGITLKIDTGTQLNLLIQPIPGVPLFANIHKFFFPVFFSRQTFEMRGFQVFLLKLLVNTQIIFTLIGSSMVMASVAILGFVIYRKYKKVLCEAKESVNFMHEQRVPLRIDLQQKS